MGCQPDNPLFFLHKLGNNSKKPVIYKIEFIEKKWSKDTNFRQFITRVQKPKSELTELSLLSDCYDYKGTEIVQWMLNRWIQENDFLYEIRCFGINYITSYGYIPYTQIVDTLADREIVNKQYTRLCAERLRLKKKWGLELVNQQQRSEKKKKQEMDNDKLITRIDETIKNSDQLEEINKAKKSRRKVTSKLKRIQKNCIKNQESSQQRIENIKLQIKEIEVSLNNNTAKISRIENLIEKDYRKLNFAPKEYMDAVKISARNIFFRLHQKFRIMYDNYRNDHIILWELIRAVGTLVENDHEITIVLHPTRQYSTSNRKIIDAFIKDINSTINCLYDHPKHLNIRL